MPSCNLCKCQRSAERPWNGMFEWVSPPTPRALSCRECLTELHTIPGVKTSGCFLNSIAPECNLRSRTRARTVAMASRVCEASHPSCGTAWVRRAPVTAVRTPIWGPAVSFAVLARSRPEPSPIMYIRALDQTVLSCGLMGHNKSSMSGHEPPQCQGNRGPLASTVPSVPEAEISLVPTPLQSFQKLSKGLSWCGLRASACLYPRPHPKHPLPPSPFDIHKVQAARSPSSQLTQTLLQATPLRLVGADPPF